MAATAIATKKVYPVDETDRYVLTLRWAASGTSDAFTVKIRWWDKTKTISSDVTILSKTATTANTWQTDVAPVIPPTGARFMQVLFSKPAVATKFAIARVNVKPVDNTLVQRMNTIDFFDDFLTATGDYGWTRSNIGGVSTATVATPSNNFGKWSEHGIVTLTTTAVSGQGGTLGVPGTCTGDPPVGAEVQVKCALSSDVNITAWGGLWSLATTIPDVALANTIYGIGFRMHNTGVASNWFGICRNGTAETTVDLGVAADTTYRVLGWICTPTGIQFTVRTRPVGAEVTTNIPNNTRNLGPHIGIVTRTASSKNIKTDFFGYQGFQTRYV